MWTCQNKSPICPQPVNRSPNRLPLVTGPTFSFLLNVAISYPKAIQNIPISMWAGYYLLFLSWGVGTMSIWGEENSPGAILLHWGQCTAQMVFTHLKYFKILWWPPVSLPGVLGGLCLRPHWWLNSGGNQMPWPNPCELVNINAACDTHPNRQEQKILVNTHH